MEYYENPEQNPKTKKVKNPLSISSFVAALVNVLFMFIPYFGIIVGGVANVLGIAALDKGESKKALAIWGIIIGISTEIICVMVSLGWSQLLI